MIFEVMKISAVLRHLLLILTWLVLWRLAVFTEYASHASIWFPPAGFTFTCFLLLRWQALPAMLIACVLSTGWESLVYQDGRSLTELIVAGGKFALLHCLVYGVSANLLRGAIDRISHHNLYAPIMRFLITVAASSLVMATAGTLLLFGGPLLESFLATSLAWWIGDMSGILVLVPVFIGIVNRIYPRRGLLSAFTYQPNQASRYNRFIGKMVFSWGLMVAVVALAHHYQSSEIACLIFFLTLPQMWIVFTESPLRMAVSLATLSFLMALLVSVLGVNEQAYIYQVAINVIACSAYFAMSVPALVADNRELHVEAKTDFLTKAVMRQHFIALTEQHLRHARRYGHQTSLLLFDVDKFKQINDRFGHLAGDEALRELAALVRSKIRSSDIFGRFGGDEFMLLLPQTSVENAYSVAESIREGIDELSFSEPEMRVSCSFGVARIDECEGFQKAFDEADRQLFIAKREGRNQTARGPAEADKPD